MRICRPMKVNNKFMKSYRGLNLKEPDLKHCLDGLNQWNYNKL